MRHEAFIGTAWNNGCPKGSGAGYGLRIPVADRDRFFKKSWRTVTLRLIGGETPRIAEVNCMKESFWNDTCGELIGKEIGRWFIDSGFAPWPKGAPPRFGMYRVAERLFEVTPGDT